MSSIYEPIFSDITAFQKRFYIIPELWEKFKFDDLNNVDFSKWKKIKLMDNTGNFSEDEIKKIPTKCRVFLRTLSRNTGIVR